MKMSAPTLLAAAALALLLAAAPAPAEEPSATCRSLDLYGYGRQLEPADTVAAHTASGLLCGQCTVRQAGAYGFLHVYGDDPATAEVEGARPGEEIVLTVNGAPVVTARKVFWSRDGARLRVNLRPPRVF
jgi:hypothetical protein